jgi:hypothetical protein
MFQRISNSFSLARSSWGVLGENKQLVVFPILSGIAAILVVLSFITPILLQPDFFNDLHLRAPWALALIGFAFYFCCYFVMIFFNAALVSCALIRFNGGEATLGDGLKAAWVRLPQIFAWALVSATVGMLLKAIENIHEKAGQIVSAILGTVWTVLTYFVVPVLVVEKVGPFAAISRSTAIIKKSWGEAIVGKIGLGLFIFLLSLPGILLLFAGGAVWINAQMAVVQAVQVPPLAWVLFGAGCLWILAVSAIGAALQGIFVSALYQYATQGEAPHGFEKETLKMAFAEKGA